jgi:hypothetical protein
MAGAAQAADGSPSMAETRKWLGRAGNSSDSLAQDTIPADSPTPTCIRYVRLVRFSFLILISRFVTLDL